MSYDLKFLSSALKEWKKLEPQIREKFKKRLLKRLENPHVPSSRLHGFTNHYKIKLRSVGYRLVYEIIEQEICVLVIAVGKRSGSIVYKKASERQNK